MSGIFDRIGKAIHTKTTEAAELRAYRLQKEHPEISYIATGKKIEANPYLDEKVKHLKERQNIKKANLKRTIGKAADLGGRSLQKFAEYDKKHGEKVRADSKANFKPTKMPRFNV